MPIERLKEVLQAKLGIPPSLVDKIINKIDRRSYEKVYWSEFLDSLTDEGRVREIVQDADIYGFGVKRLHFKDTRSLKVQGEDTLAEYYVHKLVVVNFESMPLIVTFTDDQKVQVYDGQTFNKLQSIKFTSDYGVAKLTKPDKEKSSVRPAKLNDERSRAMSNMSLEPPTHKQTTQLDMIAEQSASPHRKLERRMSKLSTSPVI
jgi:hypothetical protein